MPRRKKIKITPEIRLDAYVWALLVLEGVIDDSPRLLGLTYPKTICNLVSHYIWEVLLDNHITYITDEIYHISDNMSDFPELLALKPVNKNIGDMWFNRRYTRPRIRLLKKAIKMVGKIS